MAFPRKEIKADLQDCVRTVFAEVLRQEGFQSYRGEDLSWYRLVNDELVQSVHFMIFKWSCPYMTIGYGVHPLFVQPHFLSSAVYNCFAEVKCFPEYPPKVKMFAPWKYPEWSWVICAAPISDYFKVLTDQILPIFQKVRTMEDAYAHHKSIVSKTEKALKKCGASCTDPSFGYDMDLLTEAVYFDDSAYLESHRAGMMERMGNIVKYFEDGTKAQQKEDVINYSRFELFFAAMDKGEREAFLTYLEQEKKKNLAKLEKDVFSYSKSKKQQKRQNPKEKV